MMICKNSLEDIESSTLMMNIVVSLFTKSKHWLCLPLKATCQQVPVCAFCKDVFISCSSSANIHNILVI